MGSQSFTYLLAPSPEAPGGPRCRPPALWRPGPRSPASASSGGATASAAPWSLGHGAQGTRAALRGREKYPSSGPFLVGWSYKTQRFFGWVLRESHTENHHFGGPVEIKKKVGVSFRASLGIVCVWPKGSVAVCLGQTPQLVPPKVGQNQTRLLVTRDSRSHETILKLQPPKKRRGPLFALRTLFSPRPTRLSAPSRLGLWSARAPPRRGSRLRRRGSAPPPSCRRAPGSGPPPDACAEKRRADPKGWCQ